ncbi:uncharacterized protein LOC113290636 [Papaver somniferum]|uniref:uncharacterized protein LOC113290636 n=1 Tax=Papaver somniferum TaxID=3469 RepID=UPI000E6F59F6|nr:uncharacterized protein LOC113290636 [Papaver somniferum]
MTELLLGKGNSSDQSPIPYSQEVSSSQDNPMSQERAFNGKLAIKRSCKAVEWEFIIKGVVQDFYGGRDETRLVVEKYNHFFWSQGQSRQEKSRTICGGVFLQGIEQNPNKKVRDIVREFKSDYGLELRYDQAHAGKELCLKDLYGEDTKSYTDLVWWYEAVKKHDPGSRADLVIEGDQFKSLFLAFDACISAFEYCRPVLFLDATFLTGKFRGCLMEATGKNANNGIFPMAYGIVSGKTIENWHWFLEKLKTILGPRHLKNNVRGKTNKKKGEHGAAMDLFKQCFYSSTHEGFHQGMQKLKDMGCDGLHKFLSDLPVECWFNAHCLSCRYGDMCSNIAESFNSWIKEAKGMPIATLVNWIRLKIMDQMSKRKLKGATYKGFICPRLDK